MQPNLRLHLIFFGTLLVAACSGESGSSNSSNTSTATHSTRKAEITVAERQTLVRNFSQASADDEQQLGIDISTVNAINFQITGGADQSLFGIGKDRQNATILFFREAADFEAPADANADNVYELELTGTLSDRNFTLDFEVKVTDIVDRLAAVNDTGITLCADYHFDGANSADNNLDCSVVPADGDPVPAGQDAQTGRDADTSLSKQGKGDVGFDFTDLDVQGKALPLVNSEARCVQDNVTGLVWALKQDSGLQTKTDTFTWYRDSDSQNGGSKGDKGDSNTCTGWMSGQDETFCNVEAYVARVNEVGLCGAKDWRLPTPEELLGLVHYGDSTAPRIDSTVFNDGVGGEYWTVMPDASVSANAWAVDFDSGQLNSQAKSTAAAVRLVRGAR